MSLQSKISPIVQKLHLYEKGVRRNVFSSEGKV